MMLLLFLSCHQQVKGPPIHTHSHTNASKPQYKLLVWPSGAIWGRVLHGLIFKTCSQTNTTKCNNPPRVCELRGAVCYFVHGCPSSIKYINSSDAGTGLVHIWWLLTICVFPNSRLESCYSYIPSLTVKCSGAMWLSSVWVLSSIVSVRTLLFDLCMRLQCSAGGSKEFSNLTACGEKAVRQSFLRLFFGAVLPLVESEDWKGRRKRKSHEAKG